ncbi:MAG TPA: response regulator transcription factor [Thermodesulfobacteriota bacterium]|nr:response regulator transcription factor [Thermodesulfobacteriota bacterium]
MRTFRILIVEDNPIFRQTILDFLEVHFPSALAESAEDGASALEKVEGFRPDLIFMDIKLREENGLLITDQIKRSHPNAKIVILTSYDWPEYREAAFKFGADHFVVKGNSSNEEMVELIQSILDRCDFAPCDDRKRNGAGRKQLPR